MEATSEIMLEMNLKKIAAESREVAQALNEFADNLEQIEKRYDDMGVRLSVTWNIGCGYADRYGNVNLSSYFECPHKYYGYEKLDTSESYKYLHDILKVSEKDDPDMLRGLYDYWAPCAGPYTLTEEEFKQFVELYCKDLSEVYPGQEVGGVKMLKHISTKPGDKQIEWG